MDLKGCSSMNPCPCSERQQCTQLKSLGMDRHFGEVTLEICALCGKYWLHYLYENEGISKSGRWYRCPINLVDIQKITADEALARLEQSSETYCGGSYFDGKVGRWHGKINL